METLTPTAAIPHAYPDSHSKLRNGWRASVLAAIDGKAPAAPIGKSALEIER